LRAAPKNREEKTMSVTIPDGRSDTELPAAVTAAVRDAGAQLLASYSAASRPTGRDALFQALGDNEKDAVSRLRAALTTARPGANWVTEGFETGELPPGEWWAVDAVEGNVNHVHGLPEWCVTATLLRDDVPVLTAVHQPIGDLTYTATRGGGAFVSGARMAVSRKTDLGVAIAATGQAEAGQFTTYERIGTSITAMLGQALLVRATVPTTFPMLLVAGGQVDLFWQYEPALPGVAAGVLLVTEAGGTVSDIAGRPWRPGSPDILAAAPGLHATARKTLSLVN
jgi:myo-inositol-1(or 4)-monophosphatase